MAEDGHVVGGINWRQTFPFVHLFRGFRVAIHPSKLLLGLAMLLLLYGGGLLLDSMWRPQHRAVSGEAGLYAQSHRGAGETFAQLRQAQRERVEERYANLLREYQVRSATDAIEAARTGQSLATLKVQIVETRDNAKKQAETARKEAQRKAELLTDKDGRRRALQDAQKQYAATVSTAYAKAAADWRTARAICNEGIFRQFFLAEAASVNHVARAVMAHNWTGGGGVIPSIKSFFAVTPAWLLTQHPVYFVVFGVWFLIVLAIFGGAIARIAAVHVARDEKLSMKAALRFSLTKFLSFISAPIIPIGIVAAVGMIPLAAGLLSSIIGAGPVLLLLTGLLFFVLIAAGFVMTLVLLGMTGGFMLMYPTIAVEGSDSFDAISRSFSYIYARPWRMLFYSVVALVYGAATYLFVQLFLAIVLLLVHCFFGIGSFTEAPGTGPLWNVIWPATWARLSYPLDAISLRWDQAAAAYMIAFWVYLTIAILGSYAISYFFSSSTIIYCLLRQEVDATELDDVFLEQSEEELGEPSAVAEETAEPPAAAPSAPETPA